MKFTPMLRASELANALIEMHHPGLTEVTVPVCADEGTVHTRMAYTFIPNPGGTGAYEPTGCPSFFCRSIEKDHDVKNVQVSGGEPGGTSGSVSR